MHFCHKMVLKNSLNIFEIPIHVFLSKNYIPGAKNSLKCENSANFIFHRFHQNKKWLKQGRFSFVTIFGTGNRIFGQKYRKWPISKNFRPFFDTNSYFRNKSTLESCRWMKICLGSSNHLSKSCKKSKSLIACRYELQCFQKCTTFFGTPCISSYR